MNPFESNNSFWYAFRYWLLPLRLPQESIMGKMVKDYCKWCEQVLCSNHVHLQENGGECDTAGIQWPWTTPLQSNHLQEQFQITRLLQALGEKQKGHRFTPISNLYHSHITVSLFNYNMLFYSIGFSPTELERDYTTKPTTVLSGWIIISNEISYICGQTIPYLNL